jgi:hypothetical protein
MSLKRQHDNWPLQAAELSEDDEKQMHAIENGIRDAVNLPESLCTLVARFALPAHSTLENVGFKVNGLEEKGRFVYDGAFEMHRTWGSFKNGKVHGIVVSERGMWFRIQTFQNGLLHGISERYYQGGLYLVEIYKGGVLHGKTQRFSSRDGRLWKTRWYDHGRPCGIWTERRIPGRYEIHWRDDWTGIKLTFGAGSRLLSVQTVWLYDDKILPYPTGEHITFRQGKRKKFRRFANGRPHGAQNEGARFIYQNPSQSVWDHGKLVKIDREKKQPDVSKFQIHEAKRSDSQ